MLNKLRRFWLGEKGAVAIIVAASLIPMVTAVGVSVDLVRQMMARSALQAAVDAAAIAIASVNVEDMTDERAQEILDNYVAANEVVALQGADYQFEFGETDAGTPIVTITARSSIDTLFMGLAQIDQLGIAADTEVQRSEPYPVNLALVLDVTASMNQFPSSGGGTRKIATLKVAAKRLVETILEESENSKIAIVPYAGSVRLYPAGAVPNPVPEWIRPRPIDLPRSCRTWGPLPDGCTAERYDCKIDGIWTPNGCVKNVGTTCQNRECKVYNEATTSPWAGCIGARVERVRAASEAVRGVHETLNDQLESELSRYPGLSAAASSWESQCSASRVVELTNSIERLKTAIDRLSPSGNTYMPNGLIWGWNALMKGDVITSSSPGITVNQFKDLNLVRSFKREFGGKSVLILMTDGLNTMNVRTPDGYLLSTNSAGEAIVNSRTAAICDNIDRDDIDVYTVMFDVNDAATEAMLKNCASRVNMAYKADSHEELIKVFQAIADSLRKVRINR